MRYYIFFIFLLIGACKPYKDPAPIEDPRISNPYCNDPNAVNYNWGFPGIPDNSTCIYPADIFKGNYIWRDTVVNDLGAAVSYDSVFATVNKLDSTRIEISGRCGYDLKLSANRFLIITIDSLAGNGQQFCQPNDTIMGNGFKVSTSDTNTFRLNYTIVSDTGTSTHESFFIKQ
jgi:hypothetical protein